MTPFQIVVYATRSWTTVDNRRKNKGMKATHKVTILHEDGTRSLVYTGKKSQLDVLQKAVGGYIETLGYWTMFEGRRCTAYANEEGLLIGMAVNGTASQLWREQLNRQNLYEGDYAHSIVGPVAIIQKLAKTEGVK